MHFNAQEITKFVGTVTRLIGAFRSLGEVASTWADDSLSDSEKLSKTLSAMTMVIPILQPKQLRLGKEEQSAQVHTAGQ